MQLWKKMKKNRKGFTLVEIIVVLVILAILAAFTIPAMLGFVKDARAKAAIAQVREVYVAAQSAATEVGASTGTLDDNDKDAISKKIESQVTTADIDGFKVDSVELTAVSGDVTLSDNGAVKVYIDPNTTKVTTVVLKTKDATLQLDQGGEVVVR